MMQINFQNVDYKKQNQKNRKKFGVYFSEPSKPCFEGKHNIDSIIVY